MTLTRRLATPDDLELLFNISKRALRKQVEEMFEPWDESEQHDRLFRSTDPALHEIFFESKIPVGFMSVKRSDEELYLQRISIVPEFQNRGIGTSLIRELMEEAESSGRPLKLRVFPSNPARRLYQRLGFEEIMRTRTHVHMVWRSNNAESADGSEISS